MLGLRDGELLCEIASAGMTLKIVSVVHTSGSSDYKYWIGEIIDLTSEKKGQNVGQVCMDLAQRFANRIALVLPESQRICVRNGDLDVRRPCGI